jgi:hypothetical protein
MRVVIAGPRYKDIVNKIEFDDYSLLLKTIKSSGYNITEVISGKAIGVDSLGERWALTNNIPVNLMPADWYQYGKRAGPIRNRKMAEECDAAIILWDGISKGSRNMIDEMIKAQKPYHIGMTYKGIDDFYDYEAL